MSRTSTISSWSASNVTTRWLRRILVQPAEDLGVHLGDAPRRAQQAVAVGILADRDEDLAHGLLDPGEIDAFGTASSVTRHSSTPSGPSYSATNGRLR